MCVIMNIDDPDTAIEILMQVKGIKRHDKTMAQWESDGLARKLAACDCLEFFRKDRDRHLTELFDILDRLDRCFFDSPLVHEIIHMSVDEIYARLEKLLEDKGDMFAGVLRSLRNEKREYDAIDSGEC